jgi:hypothetical protein
MTNELGGFVQGIWVAIVSGIQDAMSEPEPREGASSGGRKSGGIAPLGDRRVWFSGSAR